MKNIRHLIVASKSRAQPQLLRLDRQSYCTTEREIPHLSLPVPLPSLAVPHTLPPSIFLSSEKQFILNKLLWLNKVCSLSVPLTLSLSHSLTLSPK